MFVCLCSVCLLSSYFSFLVAMIKYPDKSNVRRKGFFCLTVQRDAKEWRLRKSSRQEQEAAGNNIMSHPRSEKRIDGCLLSVHFLLLYQGPSPGDGAAHNKPQNEDSLRARPCSQVILERIKLVCEITPPQLVGFPLCRSCPCGYLHVRLRVRVRE